MFARLLTRGLSEPLIKASGVGAGSHGRERGGRRNRGI